MANSSGKNTKQSYPKSKRVLLYTAILLAVAVVVDLSPIGGDNIRVYSKWASCGKWPVETVGYVVGEVPSYRSAKHFLLIRGADKYFCTPLEAEKAGYSANPDRYEFPNLNAEKESQ